MRESATNPRSLISDVSGTYNASLSLMMFRVTGNQELLGMFENELDAIECAEEWLSHETGNSLARISRDGANEPVYSAIADGYLSGCESCRMGKFCGRCFGK